MAGTIADIPRGAISPGDLAIDCGANVGWVTSRMAQRGARVIAFEPNPHAFAVLKENCRDHPGVDCRNQGVHDHDGAAHLFLHHRAIEDEVHWSGGSSMLRFKSNVDPARSVRVEVVDLARLILELDEPVAVLKVDVEGLEAPILNRLMDTGAIDRVRLTLVEVHDERIPELKPELEALRDRIRREGRSGSIRLDWI